MYGYIGVITSFTGNYAPTNWSFCNGQVLQISANQALYSILGQVYGGDGKTTFALPDLRGRAPIHKGTGTGLQPYTLGQRGGFEMADISPSNMPVHTHSGVANVYLPVGTSPDTDTPGDGTYPGPINNGYSNVTPTGLMQAVNVQNVAIQPVGAGAPFMALPPFLVLNFIICVNGYFPIRN